MIFQLILSILFELPILDQQSRVVNKLRVLFLIFVAIVDKAVIQDQFKKIFEDIAITLTIHTFSFMQILSTENIFKITRINVKFDKKK